MRSSSILAVALVATTLSPAVHANGFKPGSVLVFPVQRTSPSDLCVISVTNVDRAPATPTTNGGSTFAHYEYYNAIPNPSDPFRPLNCVLSNRTEFLSPADTLSVAVTCHNPSQGEGYLVVSAEDPSQVQTAWSHDRLVGAALLVNASGGSYSINAIPFGAVAPDGRPTDRNGNGELDLDGLEYEPVPDEVYVDSFIALAGSRLSMVNLTGMGTDVNTILFQVFNDNEYALSLTREFNCWFDQPLEDLSPIFTETFLENSTPNDPGDLDVDCDEDDDLETGWTIIDSIDVSTDMGAPVATDGALLGCITAGPTSIIDGGRRLWESRVKQPNGALVAQGQVHAQWGMKKWAASPSHAPSTPTHRPGPRS